MQSRKSMKAVFKEVSDGKQTRVFIENDVSMRRLYLWPRPVSILDVSCLNANLVVIPCFYSGCSDVVQSSCMCGPFKGDAICSAGSSRTVHSACTMRKERKKKDIRLSLRYRAITLLCVSLGILIEPELDGPISCFPSRYLYLMSAAMCVEPVDMCFVSSH